MKDHKCDPTEELGANTVISLGDHVKSPASDCEQLLAEIQARKCLDEILDYVLTEARTLQLSDVVILIEAAKSKLHSASYRRQD